MMTTYEVRKATDGDGDSLWEVWVIGNGHTERLTESYYHEDAACDLCYALRAAQTQRLKAEHLEHPTFEELLKFVTKHQEDSKHDFTLALLENYNITPR